MYHGLRRSVFAGSVLVGIAFALPGTAEGQDSAHVAPKWEYAVMQWNLFGPATTNTPTESEQRIYVSDVFTFPVLDPDEPTWVRDSHAVSDFVLTGFQDHVKRIHTENRFSGRAFIHRHRTPEEAERHVQLRDTVTSSGMLRRAIRTGWTPGPDWVAIALDRAPESVERTTAARPGLIVSSGSATDRDSRADADRLAEQKRTEEADQRRELQAAVEARSQEIRSAFEQRRAELIAERERHYAQCAAQGIARDRCPARGTRQ